MNGLRNYIVSENPDYILKKELKVLTGICWSDFFLCVTVKRFTPPQKFQSVRGWVSLRALPLSATFQYFQFRFGFYLRILLSLSEFKSTIAIKFSTHSIFHLANMFSCFRRQQQPSLNSRHRNKMFRRAINGIKSRFIRTTGTAEEDCNFSNLTTAKISGNVNSKLEKYPKINSTSKSISTYFTQNIVHSACSFIKVEAKEFFPDDPDDDGVKNNEFLDLDSPSSIIEPQRLVDSYTPGSDSIIHNSQSIFGTAPIAYYKATESCFGNYSFPESLSPQCFTILGNIGTGVMGNVHNVRISEKYNLTEDTEGSSSLVAKLVSIEDLETIKHEHNILSNIGVHGNIVRSFGHFEHSGKYCMIMEKVSGQDLEKTLHKNGTFSQREAVHIMIELFSAVSFMHSRGFGHLDIKPANVMRRTNNNGSGGNVSDICLIDFGLAVQCPKKILISKMCYNSIRGTPVYSAPEICSGKLYAIEKADVWSCGVMMYELITGDVFYVPSTIYGGFSAVSKIISEKGEIDVNNCDLNDSISDEVRNVVKMCMKVDPGERATAQEALELLYKCR